MAKERLFYLDSVGAILLIHMIIGHCCQWSGTYSIYSTYTYWLSFFMPWFFFKAGMFFKSRPMKEEIQKSFRRLMIPYIDFSIIGTVLLWGKLLVSNEFSYRSILSSIKSLLVAGAVPGNLALWFLLSLFIVRILFSWFHMHICSACKTTKCLWGGI